MFIYKFCINKSYSQKIIKLCPVYAFFSFGQAVQSRAILDTNRNPGTDFKKVKLKKTGNFLIETSSRF